MKIEFREEGHEYRLDGVLVPSVTQATDWLLDFSRVPPDVLEAAARFGTAVHRMIELDVARELDEAALDARLVPYLRAWRRFLVESGFRPEVCEEVVGSKVYQYAGRLDLAGPLKRKMALLDLKSGEVPVTIGMQTAAYSRAAEETLNLRGLVRYALDLKPDRYRLIPCDGTSDLNLFLAALTIKRWRASA